MRSRNTLKPAALISVLTVTLLAFLCCDHLPAQSPPTAQENGDINGDGHINIADAVSLLSFLFLAGSPPAEIVLPPSPPVAGFIGSVTSGYSPLSIDFTDESVGDVDAWVWEFGDGELSIDQNPVHSYDTPGTYTITLSVTGPGGTGQRVRTAYVTVDPPVASFVASFNRGTVPLEVPFADESLGPVDSWLWDFGDGATSTEASPVHVYTSPGLYDVTLAVTAAQGSHTLTRTAYVEVLPPLPYSLLPATGQTTCYDQNGNVVDCYTGACPGQDGAYSTGCPPAGRFIDNGNGTITDTCTGLMWQQDTGNGGGLLDWCSALAYCEDLDLGGHDDWRLPNIRELQSIVDYGNSGPAIDPVFGAELVWYWSSTSYSGNPEVAWNVSFINGTVSHLNFFKDSLSRVRAVRSGP